MNVIGIILNSDKLAITQKEFSEKYVDFSFTKSKPNERKITDPLREEKNG